MVEDYKLEFQNFFNNTKKDKKKLSKKKKYQITLKNSILHIVEIIKTQATEEQLDKYNAIDSKVQNTISEIETNIITINDAKKLLTNILNRIKDPLNSNIRLSNKQITALKNEIEEYKSKKSLIDDNKKKDEITALLNELNDIADEITVKTENNEVDQDTLIKEDNEQVDIVDCGDDGGDTDTAASVQENYQQMQNDTPENESQEENNEYVENETEESNSFENEYTETENSEDEDIESNDIENEHINNKEIEELPSINNIIKKQSKENKKILLISEKKGKVYLPYYQSDIDFFLLIGKYKTKEEVIEELYTIPLSRYSNPVKSRIEEGFELMRKKENASIAKSLKYAFSLAFERRLHPAVITACRNMDDLEVYLGLLDEKLTCLFDVFEVKFEYRPVKANKREKLEFSEGV